MQLIEVIEGYFDARRNKRRTPDQVEFELHWQANCVNLCDAINNRCVQPSAYTFIVRHPRPREVFACDMGTRVMHHILDKYLRPILEKVLGSHTFNNRVGMGQQACQNAVISDIYEQSDGFTRDAWIFKFDLKGCFPNIDQNIAYKILEALILANFEEGELRDDLIYMLNVCIFSYPTDHCTRKGSRSDWDVIPPEKSLFTKPDGIGAAIGHLIWQNAVNYYFHPIDEWLEEIGVAHERYVDDIFVVTTNKDCMSMMIPELRRRLAKLGARLNEHKFYCQHFTKGCECLGAHIKMDRIYTNKRVIGRAIDAARSCNRNIDAAHVCSVLSRLNSYLGITKNTNGYNQTQRILQQLSPKWKEFIYFDHRRLCLSPLPQYTQRNRVIHKYNLQ